MLLTYSPCPCVTQHDPVALRAAARPQPVQASSQAARPQQSYGHARPPLAPALAPALPTARALALALALTLALALALALTPTRSRSRAGDLLRGPRAIAASSAAAVAAAAAAAAVAAAAAAAVGCVARRRRAEPHDPYPSCHRQRRRRQQQRRQPAAAAAAFLTNRTCRIGSARLRVARSCGRVEPPPAGVVRARSAARASQTQGPTDRGWPQKVGRGPQTPPTPRRSDRSWTCCE